MWGIEFPLASVQPDAPASKRLLVEPVCPGGLEGLQRVKSEDDQSGKESAVPGIFGSLQECLTPSFTLGQSSRTPRTLFSLTLSAAAPPAASPSSSSWDRLSRLSRRGWGCVWSGGWGGWGGGRHLRLN